MARSSVEVAAGSKRRRRRPFGEYRSRSARSEVLFAAVLLLRAGAILVLVIFYPLTQALLLSLKDAVLLSVTIAPFAGLENYKRLFGDKIFWGVVKNTVVLIDTVA